MKIENQVCSLEQAKKLNELLRTGEDVVPATFYHFNGKVVTEAWGNDYYPAFTVAELGVMLPDSYQLSEPTIHKVDDKKWICGNVIPDGDDQYDYSTYSYGAIEAQARAGLLIQLLEIGKTTPEEVNTRINQ